MEKELLQLVKLMREEIDLYRPLIETLDQRTEILVINDIQALARNNEASEKLILKIKSLEDTLLRSLNALAFELNLPPDRLTLSTLPDHVVHPMSTTLRNLAATLQELSVRTERINRRNTVLFTHTLEYLRALNRLVLGTTSSYQSSGALQPPALRTSSLSHEA